MGGDPGGQVDKKSLESIVAYALYIVPGAFTSDTADAFKDALAEAQATLEDASAQQGRIDEADVALRALIEALELRASLSNYSELVSLLLSIATMDASIYDPVSWGNLMHFASDAWELIDVASLAVP